MVLVDQPTEDPAPLRRLGARCAWGWDRPADIVRTTKIQPTMRSMRVVMRGILTQDVRQVSSTQDQHVIEDLKGSKTLPRGPARRFRRMPTCSSPSPT